MTAQQLASTDRSVIGALPRWASVLAVVAHPDDESLGLGGVIDALVLGGARVDVLCLTHGEASTLHGVNGDLSAVRASELAAAADVLGVRKTWMLDHPDGALASVARGVLSGAVRDEARDAGAEGLLVFDSTGITGHPDHVAATAAAVTATGSLHLPVL